jgi:Cu/Zn superoxide dismutase
LKENIMFKAYCMTPKRPLLALTGILITLLLAAACGGGNTTTTASTPAPTEGSISATGHAVLKHVPYGRAELTWDSASKMLAVKMSLTGLVPHSVHPAHIHSGSCNNPGRLIYPLQNIFADATGNATVTSTIKDIANGVPPTGWLIYVHNGPYVITTAQSLPITCGEIINPTAAKSVAVNMSSAVAEQDQAVSGAVQLTLRGSQLTVKLKLTNLQPGSIHPTQIYAGSCSRQGNVVYQLPNVVADAKGNASMTGVINNVPAIPSSGWYVNVHYSTDVSNQAGADAIVCGDIMSD